MAYPTGAVEGDEYSVGTTTYVMNSIGAWDIKTVTPTVSINEVTFTATDGQTDFTMGYTVGFLEVYRQGFKLDSSAFVATSGTGFELVDGCNVDDVVVGRAVSNYTVADSYTKAESDSNYEPVDSTILKEVDVGTKVLAPDGDGSSLTGLQSPLVAGTDYLVPTGDGSNLTGISFADIDTPTITSPTAGEVDTAVAIIVTGDAYATSDTFGGVLTGSEMRIATDSGFTSIEYTGELTASGLDPSTAYYVQIRYISGSSLSKWSEAVMFTTMEAGITAPTVETPADEAVDEGKNLSIATSAYDSFGQDEDHLNTSIQVSDASDFSNIVTETVDDEANLTSWTSGDLEVSTTYYIRARYKSASYDSGWGASVSITTADSFTTIYGLDWDEANDTYARTGEADGVTLGETGTNSSFIQSKMRRCVLRFDGTVNYYLDADDSTKKEDGTDAILDGTDGNVMVEIPKFGYKYVYDNDTHRHELGTAVDDDHPVHPAFLRDRSSDGSSTTNGVSDVTVDFRYMPAYQGSKVASGATVNAGAMSEGSDATTLDADTLMSISGVCLTADLTRDAFRTLGKANGDGWSVQDWYGSSMIQLLMLVEYGTFDSQTAIGTGRTELSDGDWECGSYWATNGKSNGAGNATYNSEYSGDADDAAAEEACMSYRGIENFYGNIRTFIDGVNVLADYQYYVSNTPADFADDVDTDYVKIGDGGADNGYAVKFAQTGKGFIVSDTTDGASNIGSCDYYYKNTGNRVIVLGGYAADGLVAGAWFLFSSGSSGLSSVAIGAAISY